MFVRYAPRSNLKRSVTLLSKAHVRSGAPSVEPIGHWLRLANGATAMGGLGTATDLLCPSGQLPQRHDVSTIVQCFRRPARHRLTMRSSGPCGMKFPVQSCVAARTAA